MTAPMRLEHDLPALLEDVYLTGTPHYRDDLVQRLHAVRQRPAWMFPERWLPMDLATPRPLAFGLPWRAIATLGLIALLLAATLAVYIGSQPRLPAPFGFARNGQIAYTFEGDTYIRDTLDAAPRVLLGDAATDIGVLFSPLGDRVALLRTPSAGPGEDLWTMRADGSDLQRVGGPYIRIDWMEWSPDQATIALGHVARGLPTVTLVAADGSGDRRLVDFPAMSPTFRPPDGHQLVFRGQEHGTWSFYLVELPDGDPVRLDLRQGRIEGSDYDNQGPAWSPTGDRLAFSTMVELPRSNLGTPGLRVNVATIDAAGIVLDQRHLEFDPIADDELNPAFTPDGQHIVFQRRMGATEPQPGATPDTVDTLHLAAADGSRLATDLGVVARGGTGIGYTIAPDGTSLLAFLGQGEVWVIEPSTGTARKADIDASEGPTWQRAPA